MNVTNIPVISSAKPVSVWRMIPAAISTVATDSVKCLFAFIVV